MTPGGIEIRQPRDQDAPQLSTFFSSISADGDDVLFHPHPLTVGEARRICTYTGQDLYYIIAENLDILGYGMLRGWDAGYTVPSLGIAIKHCARGTGLGALLMLFLHAAARRRGAQEVMLKVCKSNVTARKMYEKLGYKLVDAEGEYLVGSYRL